MPGPPDKLFKKASRKHESGDFQTAATLYRRILKRNPAHIDCLYMYGTLCAEQGDLSKAEHYLKQAVELAPNSPLIQNNLGNVYLKSGHYPLAAACYTKALQLDPAMAQTSYNLGQCHVRQGQLHDAVLCFEKSLARQARFFPALFALGKVNMSLGKYDRAIAQFHQALELQPQSTGTLHALASAYALQEMNEEAITCYERLLALNPHDESAQHALNVLQGERSPRAPKQHVAMLFDEMSDTFEAHLHKLGYQVPQWIYEALIEQTGPEIKFSHMLDMGCGTGLGGQLFSLHVVQMDGIDLSPRMIREAKRKEVYDHLEVADLLDYLEQCDDKFDLLLATDVFTYLGDLHPVFEAVVEVAEPGAWFLFSTEECEAGDYELRPTGRYAQSMAYIESLAQAFGFAIPYEREIIVREDRSEPVAGRIYLLQFNRGRTAD